MSKVMLEVGKTDSGVSAIHLSINNQHLGTIFGTLKFPDNEFDRKYNIFRICEGTNMLAIIWNVSLVEDKTPYGTHRIKVGGVE